MSKCEDRHISCVNEIDTNLKNNFVEFSKSVFIFIVYQYMCKMICKWRENRSQPLAVSNPR